MLVLWLIVVAARQDEATVRQLDKIQKEVSIVQWQHTLLDLSVFDEQIAESSELVGDVEDVHCLASEYSSDDNVYQAKIKVGESINFAQYKIR